MSEQFETIFIKGQEVRMSMKLIRELYGLGEQKTAEKPAAAAATVKEPANKPFSKDEKALFDNIQQILLQGKKPMPLSTLGIQLENFSKEKYGKLRDFVQKDDSIVLLKDPCTGHLSVCLASAAATATKEVPRDVGKQEEPDTASTADASAQFNQKTWAKMAKAAANGATFDGFLPQGKKPQGKKPQSERDQENRQKMAVAKANAKIREGTANWMDVCHFHPNGTCRYTPCHKQHLDAETYTALVVQNAGTDYRTRECDGEKKCRGAACYGVHVGEFANRGNILEKAKAYNEKYNRQGELCPFGNKCNRILESGIYCPQPHNLKEFQEFYPEQYQQLLETLEHVIREQLWKGPMRAASLNQPNGEFMKNLPRHLYFILLHYVREIKDVLGLVIKNDHIVFEETPAQKAAQQPKDEDKEENPEVITETEFSEDDYPPLKSGVYTGDWDDDQEPSGSV